jgi:putative transposase
MSPLAKWEEGIFGNDQVKGIGMPPIIVDEQRLKLDLMPYEIRTVQPYGIVWDHIEYQSDVLRRWINAQDPENSKAKQKFLCRRDPRDISSIWFYDPEVEQHYQIPYRNTSHPAVSIWEWRKAEKRAEESYPDIPIDENLIFSAYDKIAEVVEKAKKETKAVRKEAQRKRIGIQSAKAHLSQESKPTDSESDAGTAKANKAVAPKRVVKTFEIDDMQEDDS